MYYPCLAKKCVPSSITKKMKLYEILPELRTRLQSDNTNNKHLMTIMHYHLLHIIHEYSIQDPILFS